MIAAPIVRPADPATGLASVDVWVPRGTWIDYQTQETFTGPSWVRLVGDLERLPLLVREGAILPLAPLAPTTVAIPADELIVEVFPGRAGAVRIYEDDGATQAYQQGQYEWTPIIMQTESNGVCKLQIGPTEGRCDALPEARSYEVRFPATRRPDRVLIDGKQAGDWTYDATARTTAVGVPRSDKRQSITLAVLAAGGIEADSPEHNRACILADVRRLLGPAYPEVPWEELPASVGALDLDHPGRADALARLGGPFVQVLEYVTLPEAARRLGSVIVAAPAAGTPFDVTCTWRLHSSLGTEERVQSVTGAREDQILHSPFAFDGVAQPLDWEAEVSVRGEAGRVVHRHRSATICPAVPVWRIAVYDPRVTPLSPTQVMDMADPAAQALPWLTHAVDPTRLASLAEPFRVPLAEMYRASQEAGAPPAAYAVTTVVSPNQRDVRIAYGTLGAGACWLNGQQVAEDGAKRSAKMGWGARVSEPVRLRAGPNTVVLHLAPALGAPPWHFVITAVLVDLDGAVATGVGYEGQPLDGQPS